MDRNPRKDIKKQKPDLSEPILDFSIFNLSKNDPCFGKLWDLRAEECSQCGDAEFCGILFSQNLHKKREELGKNNSFIDEEHAEFMDKKDELRFKRLKKFINKKKEEGLSKKTIKTLCEKKFKTIAGYQIDQAL